MTAFLFEFLLWKSSSVAQTNTSNGTKHETKDIKKTDEEILDARAGSF